MKRTNKTNWNRASDPRASASAVLKILHNLQKNTMTDATHSLLFPAFHHRLAVAVVMVIAITTSVFGQARVSETVHNLSVSGPGPLRAASESQVCVFCHAPHNTQGLRPLWNRELSAVSYSIYQSTTLNALPGQPTGSSKLCLSCHDGTIALGSVLSRAEQIRMTGGDFIPAGPTNLGTDLADDHPVSFHFSSGLAAADRQLVSPTALPPEVRLDANGQMQCTSCHDPHHNLNGDFLVRRPEFGELCMSCHQLDGWNATPHRTSNANVTGSPQGTWPFSTVAENACQSCHRSHTAGGEQRLLMFEEEEDNCLSCHDGNVANFNMLSEINKFSAHDPRDYLGRHDPTEANYGTDAHVECADCHNPHAVAAASSNPGYIPIGPTLAFTRGVTIGGAEIETALNEYEVCFRCHGDAAVPISGRIQRLAQTDNLRLKFAPSNPSFHPVAGPSPSMDTVSLVPGLAHGSLIRCTDCHNNNDSRRLGGGGPDGPHGSNFDFLLAKNYTVSDDTSESEGAYSMCYQCHRRSSILDDESFSEHKKHIVDERTPCSACHDPHGVPTIVGGNTDRTHLINFDTTIVRPHPQNGRLEFRDTGHFSGNCTLICHGEVHNNEDYNQD